MDQNTQFGQYTLVKKLASGGMAEIYLARTGGIRGFEKSLVLKMIHPKWSMDENFINMLIDEAKLAVNLNHANIAQVFDLGRHQDTYYIAMEFVDGRDLFQVLVRTSERDTYIPFDVAAFITEQIAAALHYAHTRLDPQGQTLQLIHRDVSPQNVIISMNGEVKLIDFGIAKATMRPGHTQVGIIKGKFYYMSPEQAWGRPLDHRTDVFSLGICLHEMLTGQMLYAEDDQLLLLEKVRAADIPLPSTMRTGIPKELEAVVMRALAADANQRFQTAFDFQRALTEYLHRNSPGFTPTRGARMMYDLFPEASANNKGSDDAINGREFDSMRPPESVIFDLSMAGRPGKTASINQAAAAPPKPRGRREATKPVKAMGTNNGDKDVFTGDGLGAEYPVSPKPKSGNHHPPPPLADSAMGSGNSGLRPMKGGGKVSKDEGSTTLFSTDTLPPQPPGRPRASAPPPPMELDADERTMMFNPNDMAPPPGLGKVGPPPPSSSSPRSGLRAARPTPKAPPMELDADERTMMFNPNDMAPPPGLAKPKAVKRAPAPAPKAPPPSSLRPAPAAPPVDSPDRTTLFDPSLFPSPTGAPPGEDPPTVKVKPSAVNKALSREEKIALAKKNAKSDQDSLKDRIKKGGDDEGEKKPLTREEKIALAKKKAKSGPPGKKPGGGNLSREEKIALAKKKAKGGPPGMKKKPGGGDSRQDKIAAAKEKARQRSGKPGGAKKPNKVSGQKGNADKSVRIAGRQDKILGMDANSGAGKALRLIFNPITLGFVGLMFIGGCIGIYAIVAKITEPPPPQYGTIQVTSFPAQARIEFDGIQLDGKTPYTIDKVDPETIHSLRLSLPNHVFQMRNNIRVDPGETQDVHIVLEPSPGSLLASSEPPGAEVLVDDKVKCKETPCVVKDLPRTEGGFINVVIRKEGFVPFEAPLQWKTGELELKVTASLEPVPNE